MKTSLILAFLITIGFISCNKITENNVFQVIAQNPDSVNLNLNHNESKYDSKKMPDELYEFIPENYLILDSLSCDLNKDGVNDYLLILKHKDEATLFDASEEVAKRPLLILIRNKANQLELKFKNENVVYCFDCGGMMKDPYVSMVCKEDYFSVEHYGGSSWRWTRIITFKYNKIKEDWFLHKDGSDSFHVSNPSKVKSQIQTIKNFGVVPFEEYDIYK